MSDPNGWKDEGESPKWFIHKRVIDTLVKKEWIKKVESKKWHIN